MDRYDTIGARIEDCAAQLRAAGVYFGHGTVDAVDEAALLVLHAAGLDPTQTDPAIYSQPFPADCQARLTDCLHQRIALRRPAPYITGEAWFAGLPFTVDERVLIPRSPFAELIQERFAPWLRPGPVRQILEVGTGSGCIAIAAALAFPEAQVTATDISPEALAVAMENRRRYALEARLELREADLLTGLSGPYDLILSNPPYVAEAERAELPAEYKHEPGLGLFSGADGLDCARRILQDAASCLAADGLLALEVGSGWLALEQDQPRLPMVWPEFEAGGEGIALIQASDLGEPNINTRN
jgi:ribosomal protein L3 glutamine methyltransferase